MLAIGDKFGSDLESLFNKNMDWTTFEAIYIYSIKIYNQETYDINLFKI